MRSRKPKGELIGATLMATAGAGEQMAEDAKEYWRLMDPTASVRTFRRTASVDGVSIPFVAVVARRKLVVD